MNPYFGELYHYGIKGQKWGVRRFQNSDMTWTEAGKIRYGRKKNGSRKVQESISDGVRKSGALETIQKRNIAKTHNIDAETLKNTKLKDIDLTKYKPKHDTNSKSEAYSFATSLATDLFVPGMQIYLPLDIYRGGKAAIGKYKSQKYSKERESNPIDKATGFHLKTQNLSEEEDLKRVNPDFNDFNSNSKSNCVLCTMTCEMRKRGYDVTANKAGIGYYDNELKNFFKNYKVEHIGDTKSIKNDSKTIGEEGSFANRIVNRIEKSQPEGSRGNLSVQWTMFGGGHSMYYEIKNGKMVIYDGQSGKIYSNPEKILKKCSSVDIGRLDNLQFDKKGIKECCK